MNCPVCHVTLQMAERQGVEIDFCPQCRGVWLDRGELDKIIERSAQETHSRPASVAHEEPYGKRHGKHYDKHDDRHSEHHDLHKPYKKRSFLHDLFD